MSAPTEPLVVFEDREEIQVGTIRASSVLSAGNVAEFGNEVLAHIAAHPGGNLVLNFEHVDYLSSAVLNELLRINKAVQADGGQLRLCAVSDVILEVFQITNLDKLFTIHSDDLESDIKRFKRSLDIAAQEAAWEDPL